VLGFFFVSDELLFAGCPDAEEFCAGAMLACSNSADKRVAVKRAANIAATQFNPICARILRSARVITSVTHLEV